MLNPSKALWITLQLGLGLVTVVHLQKDRTLFSRRADVTVVQAANADRLAKNNATILQHTQTEPHENQTAIRSPTPTTSQLMKNESTTAQETPFPRWSEDIQVEPLVEAIRVTLDGKVYYDRAHRIYIVDQQKSSSMQLWRASAPRDLSLDQAPGRRADRMEMLAVQTLKFLAANPNATEHVYPNFYTAMQQGGFAYIANHADSTFCCDKSPFLDASKRNLVSDVVVPIFTLSAPVDCSHTFPVPTYETIKHAVKPWNALVTEYKQQYPWSSKHRQAVWRGAPTGNIDPNKNMRIQLCDRSQQRPDLINAKLTKKRRTGFEGLDESQYLGGRISMPDFQQYRAIIDVDGKQPMDPLENLNDSSDSNTSFLSTDTFSRSLVVKSFRGALVLFICYYQGGTDAC